MEMQEGCSISIRDATSADVPAVAHCLVEAFEEYRDSYSPGAFADTVLKADALERRMESMCVLVAVTLSGQVVGTIAYQIVNPGEGDIRGMAVLPQAQGLGVAKQLLDVAESKLRDMECSRIMLETTAPLSRAIHFYERKGFRRSGRVTDFFGMPLIEYEKVLASTC
jgi:putative acetyltransferase